MTEQIAEPFEAFPKIPRLARDVVITEKIDGTNAQVCVLDDGRVLAGSRTKWITPGDDNFGFATWVKEHEDELRTGLGIGRHYGEWWGSGIQRRYGLRPGERRFSLFNTGRWVSRHTDGEPPIGEKQACAPVCCHVVPILYAGPFTTTAVDDALARLRDGGSLASPGFMNPEGVVVYHVAAGAYFKRTILKDNEPKGREQAA